MKDEQLAYNFHREVHVLWAKDKIVLVFEMMKGKKYEHLKISHDEFVVVAPIGLLHFCSGLHVRRLCTRYYM